MVPGAYRQPHPGDRRSGNLPAIGKRSAGRFCSRAHGTPGPAALVLAVGWSDRRPGPARVPYSPLEYTHRAFAAADHCLPDAVAQDLDLCDVVLARRIAHSVGAMDLQFAEFVARKHCAPHVHGLGNARMADTPDWIGNAPDLTGQRMASLGGLLPRLSLRSAISLCDAVTRTWQSSWLAAACAVAGSLACRCRSRIPRSFEVSCACIPNTGLVLS